MSHPSTSAVDARPSTPEDVDDITKNVTAGVTEVQGDLNFYETVTAAPLNPFSRTSLQLYMILLVAALNATASGFDGVSFDLDPKRNQYLPYTQLNRCAVDIQLH